ncbi:MAG: hypothetical protein RLZZ215_925 [Pseudomonadota bacterium]|jgi:hypothetical protein
MMIKKLSLFLWLILMQAPSWSASEDFKFVFHHSLTDQLASSTLFSNTYLRRGYAFSHDDQLLAFYQSGKELEEGVYEGSTLQIWGTQTGKLKYSTTLPRHQAGGSHRRYSVPIVFSPDNQMLIRASANPADIFVWPFTKTKQISVLCPSLGDWEDEAYLQGISQNQQFFFFTSINFDVICRQQEKALYYKKHDKYSEDSWEVNNAKVFHNSRPLFIYNIQPASSPPMEAIRDPLDFNKKDLIFAKLWNLDFTSKSEQLMQAIDQAQQRFILAEVFKDQVVIHQWNYANRQKIGSQVFKGLQIKPLDDSKMSLYLSGYYLLIKADTKLTVFKRQDQQFSFVWSKDIPLLKSQPYLTMSKEGRYIVSANDDTFQDASESTLIDTVTGKIISSYQNKDDPKRKNNSRTLIIEPVLTRFLNQRLDERMTDYDQACSEQAKTKLYSLLTHQVVQEIEGEVVAMSADHKLLAVCQGRKLVLMRNVKSGS